MRAPSFKRSVPRTESSHVGRSISRLLASWPYYSSTRIISDDLTNVEYAVLGLLVERPSHGYDLEQVIQQRGVREWTELAFSSIYFILNRLEKRGFASSHRDPQKKTRKIYSPTPSGREAFQRKTIAALDAPHPVYPSILLGLSNWPTISPQEGIDALARRLTALTAILANVEQAQARSGPAPPFVTAVFDYSLSQLRSEIDWLRRTMKLLGDNDEQD